MFTLQLEQFKNLLTDRSILMWSVHDIWDKGYHDSMCLKSGCLGKREQELAWFFLIVVSYPPLIYGSGISRGRCVPVQFIRTTSDLLQKQTGKVPVSQYLYILRARLLKKITISEEPYAVLFELLHPSSAVYVQFLVLTMKLVTNVFLFTTQDLKFPLVCYSFLCIPNLSHVLKKKKKYQLIVLNKNDLGSMQKWHFI